MLVDPPFCPLSTCLIRYLSRILQQFHGGPLLLVQPIFSKPPWGLQLRDLSNSIVILGSPSLHLGPFRHTRPTQAPYDHLNTSGPLRHPRPIRHHPRPTQAPQANSYYFLRGCMVRTAYKSLILFFYFFISPNLLVLFIYLFILRKLHELNNHIHFVLFIYLLIYFDRKLLELIIHFSFACDLYF